MTQAELQKVLRAADPAAVLVSARILERVIREDYRLPNMHWNIPHYKSFVCDRQQLFRHAEQADLELESDQLLPDTVILLVRPDAEEMSNLERTRLLLKYWRRLFHARVHVALGSLHAEGRLDELTLRERIEAVGRTEFEEVRDVLDEDHWLPPDASDREVYTEFAAVYLEMRLFAASLLPNYFPGIRDFGKVEQLLARDIDALSLFESTRLKGAADPVQPVDARTDESQELYWSLVRSAQKSANEGNLVGAAILRLRASRVAPAAQTLPTRQEAEKDIAQLSKRLGEALGLTETETADWTRHLTLLLDKADQGTRPIEARVLEELLKVCMDHEQEIYTLDVVEYLLSAGKRPIKRPLPSQRMVRVAKHLRSAAGMLGPVRLSDTDRNHLARLMQQALRKTEDGLRTRFRPVLVTAMEDVGLRPNGPLEQAAFEKMVAELLDRINSYGFLTFAELRDTISRNQLKLPDLTEPEDFIKGDALIRLDRRLGSLLDGVYRPGEFYVRWLERFTSLQFGTWWGRLLSRFVLAPFLLAWLVALLLGMIVEKTDHWVLRGRAPLLETAAAVLMGPAHQPPARTAERDEESQNQAREGSESRLPQEEPAGQEPRPPALPPPGTDSQPAEVAAPPQVASDPVLLWWHGGVLTALSVFCLVLLESATARRWCLDLLAAVWRGLHLAFWRLPVRLVPIETMRRILQSWLFQVTWWYVAKPGVVCLVLAWAWSLRWPDNFYGVAALYLTAAFLINSRVGRATSESIQDSFVSLGRLIRGGLLPSLVQFIIYVFKRVGEGIEYLLFVVDEWLRFRSGEGRLSLVVRTAASVLWFPIAYIIRFYTLVLIEPMLNPLKLPLSILAAKVIYPGLAMLGVWTISGWGFSSPYVDQLAPFLTYPVAWLLVIGTLYLSPDAIAYLAWELRENWRLYRANRGKAVGPAAIGAHGETVRGLLHPGFHSGTVPRLYARLRAAERRAAQTRNWDRARAYRHEVEEVAGRVQGFLEREMLLILKSSSAWQEQAVSAGPVSLSTNRIRFELEHLDHPAAPVEFEVEHRRGWLVAGIREPGWLEALRPEQRRVFASCLAYFYKRAEVDLVREQLRRVIPGPVFSWQLTEDELLLWRGPEGPLEPIALTEEVPGEGPREIDKLLFSRAPLTWQEWDGVWRWDAQGVVHPGLQGIGELVLPVPTADAPAPAPSGDGGAQIDHPASAPEFTHEPPASAPLTGSPETFGINTGERGA